MLAQLLWLETMLIKMSRDFSWLERSCLDYLDFEQDRTVDWFGKKKCWMMPTILTLWIMISLLGWEILRHLSRGRRASLTVKEKNKMSNRSGGLETDSASEYEPFHFPHLNKWGHPRAKNASSIVPSEFCRVVRSIC
jgi:hypothetical protein